MIIQQLDLIAFGLFTGKTLDFEVTDDKRPFHLIYGPNESGKSTSLRAITALLFGMPHRAEDNYLHTNTQLRIGGTLVSQAGQSLRCIRRRGRKGTLRDENDDQTIDETAMHRMLGGIDRETFLRRFGLSHDELIEGGAAILRGDGDLGEILFAAGAGISKLSQLRDQLDDDGKRLFAPRGTKVINSALKDLEQQRKELREAQLPPAEFTAQQKRIEQAKSELAKFNDAMHKATVELARLKSFQSALPLIPLWKSDIRELGQLGNGPSLDADFTQRRRQIESDREAAASQCEDLARRLTDLTNRMEAVPEDSAVLGHEAEIQTLFQEVSARDKADRDRIDLIRVQKNLDRRINELLQELSVRIVTSDQQETDSAVEDAVVRLRISDSLRSQVHDLAAKHERLIGQRDDARDSVATIKKRIDELDHELQLLENVTDPTALGSVIDSVGSPATLLETLAAQQEDCQQTLRACQAATRRLDGFAGDYKQAAQLTLPQESAIQQTTQLLAEATERLSDARKQHTQLCRDRDQAAGLLHKQQSATRLPTFQELEEGRQQRDDLVDALEQSPTAEGVAKLRQSIRQCDETADLLQQHHQEVHQRQQISDQISSLDQRIADVAAEIEISQQELKTHQLQWQSLWDACGVVADRPERMVQWVADHKQLVALFERLSEQQDRVQQSERRIARATNRLRSALSTGAPKRPKAKAAITESAYSQGSLFDEGGDEFDSPSEDLESLYDEAVTKRGELMRRVQQRDTLLRRREEQAEELPAAETRLETFKTNVDQWDQQWRQVTQAFAEQENATTSVVMAMIRRIDQLCDKKRERDILASRIRSIGEDEHAFTIRVTRLAETLAISDADSAPASATTQRLYQRLQSERSAAKQREMLHEQIVEVERRLEAAKQQQSDCQRQLQQLCNEAKCESPEELPEIENRCRRQQQLQISLRDLENQLTLLAGDDAIEDFIEAASEQSQALLDVQIEQQEREVKTLRKTISQADQDLGVMQHQADSISGSGRASDLLQSVQLTLGRIGRDAEEYAKLKIASYLLRQAIDHYRKDNQSPVLAIADDYFRKLTCGEYRGLKVDFDAKGHSILFGLRDTGSVAEVPAPSMSTGTADALYLSLRLASLTHQLSQGAEPVPLIVDDCLIQMDDQRAAAAMQALSEVATKTQVMMFTHHQHLLDLAQTSLGENEYCVHSLGS